MRLYAGKQLRTCWVKTICKKGSSAPRTATLHTLEICMGLKLRPKAGPDQQIWPNLNAAVKCKTQSFICDSFHPVETISQAIATHWIHSVSFASSLSIAATHNTTKTRMTDPVTETDRNSEMTLKITKPNLSLKLYITKCTEAELQPTSPESSVWTQASPCQALTCLQMNTLTQKRY